MSSQKSNKFKIIFIMRKKTINVPFGIRYISDWKDFNFQNFPDQCIINKQLPGCGFTEFCIRNSDNIILCSPRKMLLQNKTDQHLGEVFLVKNELETELGVDKDISKDQKNFVEYIQEISMTQKNEVFNKITNEFVSYYHNCQGNSKPVKILVTYDSYRIVKDILTNLGIFDQFYTIVDEFQTILHDSRFKSSTELEFMNTLGTSKKVCFVSATPMIDEYLGMLDEFKNLPYFSLDWSAEDPGRIIKPNLKVLSMKSVGSKAEEIIKEYRSGDFEKAIRVDELTGKPYEIFSKEAVFYVNSVNHIISIIKRNSLEPDEINILCSNTTENAKKIKKRLGKRFTIGTVPLKGEERKMFTFCTRTVYLGADFYSDNARSFIFSDSNYDCLSVDISQDLPQILGRQRLNENPWKNSATFFYRTTCDYRKVNRAEFEKFVEEKKRATYSLLTSYESSPTKETKSDLAKSFKFIAGARNYRENYVAVNTHGGSSLQPVFNNLVLVSDIRAYDIQQIDYKDRFSVFCSINAHVNSENTNIEIAEFFKEYDSLTTFYDKIRLLCNYKFSSKEIIDIVLNQLGGDKIRSYYVALGPEKLHALGYNQTKIEKTLGITMFDEDVLKNKIYSTFLPGDKYSLAEIKEKLKDLYNNLGYKKTPKAIDLLNYFEVKDFVYYEKDTLGKRKQIRGYEIISKKL